MNESIAKQISLELPVDQQASKYLVDFFSSGGRSVLVRGDPGTGKTSLVLQLLDYHAKNGFKSVYMSTRLSAKTLKSHQPWVEVVQGKYGTVPRLAEDQIGFQDSRRMDGVRAISGLRAYLEQVSNPFVVLDSWEGLMFESHSVGVEEISKLVEDYEARFVVVTERREQTDLDYLLDGVIVLRRKYFAGRVVREIELKKLRGVCVVQSRFLFTLDQGKFAYLPPLESNDKEEPVGEPLVENIHGLYSSGSSTLDSMIGGGFHRGSFNLVENANDLPTQVSSLFLRTVISNFVNRGHKVVYVPFLDTGNYDLKSILPNLSSETMEESITTLSYKGGSKSGQDNPGLTLKGEPKSDFELIGSAVDKVARTASKPPLLVLSQNSIEGFYGAGPLSQELAKSIAETKNAGLVRIQLATTDSPLSSEMRALCDVDMRFEMLDGTPIGYSAKPISPLHGIVRDPEAPGKIGLIRII